MAVKIRLKRMGKIRVPQYRIVVVDSRKKRDGKVLEEVGIYQPKEDPSYIEVVSERVQYWLGVGAQPSDAVAAVLKVTGDWQKFKGLPGAEGTMKTAEPKRDKTAIFNEALKEAGGEPKGDAVTSRSKKAGTTTEPADEPVPAATETPVAETPEGAADQAEAEEARQVDAEQQAASSEGDVPADKGGDSGAGSSDESGA